MFMTIDDIVKSALRITTDDPGILNEIDELIESARLELIQSGVSSAKSSDDMDALIRRAITLYAKANFGFDNPDADRFQDSFNMLKNHLALSSDYNGENDAI